MRTNRMSLPALVSCGGAMIAALALPTAARAQADVEFIPYFATYYAVSSLGFNNDPGEDFSFKQGSTPMAGGRLRARVSTGMSVEANVAYGNSSLTGFFDDPNDDPDLGETGVAFKGNIMFVNGRILFRPQRSNLYVMVGGGIVKRGGNAWTRFVESDKKTSFGGLLGFGVRAAITPRISLDVGVEANLYSTDPDGDKTIFDSKFQQDILVTVGIPLGLIGR